jgi:hypothetical protein
MNKQEVEICITEGGGGMQVYVNDLRIAGNKPWGGGTVIKTYNVKRSTFERDIAEALRMLDFDEEDDV